EWARSWIFWGFPWNPLSVSQWNRPAVLSMVPVTGGWGLSFILIWINVALAQWWRKPFTEWKTKGFLPVARKVPVVLVVPIGIMLVSAGWYFWSSLRREASEPIPVGFVQPYATMKWDQAEVTRNIERLWKETQSLAEDHPAIVLWPESSTPIPVIGEYSIREGVEALSREIDSPILMGNMAFYREEGIYENAVFRVDPDGGLEEEYYVKRELVPFGEFIPFRKWIPFLEKVVPIGLDCRPGERPFLFSFPAADSEERIGPLICYEDVFPYLSREAVQLGADWLFVSTNNVWYGEEAGAYQHAAHSVLRAVETRRPVLRSGNGGWSGWIDEWGNVRREITDSRGTIYFQGAETVEVDRDLRFDGVLTPFVKYGNWFIGLCGLLAILGGWRLRARG
ncbi:MAG: apolipoprotein N-acyltransferase, partial [Puniceicoccales bacterium]